MAHTMATTPMFNSRSKKGLHSTQMTSAYITQPGQQPLHLQLTRWLQPGHNNSLSTTHTHMYVMNSRHVVTHTSRGFYIHGHTPHQLWIWEYRASIGIPIHINFLEFLTVPISESFSERLHSPDTHHTL